jgi:hypothetical protein
VEEYITVKKDFLRSPALILRVLTLVRSLIDNFQRNEPGARSIFMFAVDNFNNLTFQTAI